MVMSDSKLYDFKNPARVNESTNGDGINSDKITSASQPFTESGNDHDNKNSPEQKSTEDQDPRLKELKYSFSPEDELPILTKELLYHAANPKNIGIFSSGGLSNKIIKKLMDKYSNSFQDYKFKTTFKTFDHSIVATTPTSFMSEEPETTEEGKHPAHPAKVTQDFEAPPGTKVEPDFEPMDTDYDDEEFEFEPDPGYELEGHPEEFRRQDEYEVGEPLIPEPRAQEYSEEPEEPLESEVKKPKHLTFRERAYQIFHELKKKLGLVKPKPPKEPKPEETELTPQEPMTEEEIYSEEFRDELEASEVSRKDEIVTPEYGPDHGFEPSYEIKPYIKSELKSDQKPDVKPGEEIKKPSEEETGSVIEVLENKDILFIFTCLDDEFDIENVLTMSELAKRKNILSIVIASLPRYFGKVEKVYAANQILQRLRLIAEIVILIPYYETIDFRLIPRLIHEMLEIIIKTGLINVDVADLKIVVKGGNVGIVTFGFGKHATRHKDALFEAIDSKLLNVELAGVDKALLNVTGSKNITLAEVEGLADQIKNRIAPEARFILGTNIDPEMVDSLKIFLLLGVKPMQVMVNKYANE